MISNPISFFAGGSGRDSLRDFTYTPGHKLYHFSPNDNQLSNTMEHNLIFFANDEDHARQIFKDMCEFVLDCLTAQAKHYRETRSPNNEEFLVRDKYTFERFSIYLEKVDTIRFTEAPINQFYKVGWAVNDTIR